MNLVENLAPFVALVIVAALTGTSNEMTVLGRGCSSGPGSHRSCWHTAGIPYGRTLTFAVGWAGMIIIFLQVIG